MEQLRAKKALQRIVRDFPEYSPPPPVQQTAPDVVVHQRGGIKLADMWECALKKRPLSRTHKGSWDRFLAWCPVKYADLVTPRVAQEYLEKHYGSGNGKSFNNNKTNLNTIFRCCLVEANLTVSPFASIINRRVTEIENHRNLTLKEFALAMSNAPLQLQIMFMLSRWTAQRLETCYRMTPDMFDFDKLVFVIDPGKNKRFKEWVCCPIMPELEAFIRPLIPCCREGVSIVRSFSPWVCNKYTKETIKLFRALKIDDTDSGKASFHSLRGTSITWFKEHGVTGDDLRSITGHDDDRVEQIYARPIANISKIANDFKKGLRE